MPSQNAYGMPTLSPVKDGGVSGAWDRLPYIRLCLHTTLTCPSLGKEQSNTSWENEFALCDNRALFRAHCQILSTKGNALGRFPRSNSSFAATVAFIVPFWRKVSGGLGKFRTIPWNVYPFMELFMIVSKSTWYLREFFFGLFF